MTLLEVFGLAFHLSGVLVLAVFYLRFRGRIRSSFGGSQGDGGDGGGSDRVPLMPVSPWSWHHRPRHPGPHLRTPPRSPWRGSPTASRAR